MSVRRLLRLMANGIGPPSSAEIIPRQHVRPFIRRSFVRLRKLKASGVDLEMPIVSAVAGAAARVLRHRFGEFFLALEALHSLHLEQAGKTFLLEKATFRKAREDLSKEVGPTLRRRGVRSDRVRRQMEAKLGELNRPPLWRGIEALLRKTRVDWDDLYPRPTPKQPTFIAMRNSLFHSHARHDDETVFKESLRLESVVHRILLRWLGWEDLWSAPSPDMRYYIAGYALPDKHKLSGRSRRKRRKRISSPS